jgi:hypothetical protein
MHGVTIKIRFLFFLYSFIVRRVSSAMKKNKNIIYLTHTEANGRCRNCSSGRTHTRTHTHTQYLLNYSGHQRLKKEEIRQAMYWHEQ